MRARSFALTARFVAPALFVVLVGACGPSVQTPPATPIESLRAGAAHAQDGEALGRWLLGELLVPGGDITRAQKARTALDKSANNKGIFASLARGLDNDNRGRFRTAALAYIDAVDAARISDHPDAPMIAWFAAHHLLRLRSSVTNLWDTARPTVIRSLDQPGNIGWRARSVLGEWWSADGLRKEPAVAGKSMQDVSAQRFGCISKARLAGPFGHFGPTDHRTHFEAERAGPWPRVFPGDPRRTARPRIVATEHHGCQLNPAEPTEGGIYYAETFLDLPAEREVIIAVQGAIALLVDDVEVLTRDPKEWGVWPRFWRATSPRRRQASHPRAHRWR